MSYPRLRKGRSNFEVMRLHIGKEIERRYKESGLKQSEFARRLSTSPRNVYAIFERSEIKTDMLLKISEVLDFNFFSLYIAGNQANEPKEKYSKEPSKSNSLSIIIELDGTESTLNQAVKRLTAFNKSMG
jgi:plasmid maintenance system antidote protein VapI